MHRIAERLPMQRYERGSTIYEPGTSGERLFILKEGRARLYRLSGDGRKLVLTIAQPGTTFGEMAMLGQFMAGTYAEPVDTCLVCVMTREDLEEIVSQHPPVAMRVITLLARRLQKAEQKLEQVAFQPIAARVAEALLDLANERDEVEGFSQQELAEVVGASRESVTRTLVEFKQARLVAIRRRCIRILDRSGLELRTGDGVEDSLPA